jgi:hypothetical protein
MRGHPVQASQLNNHYKPITVSIRALDKPKAVKNCAFLEVRKGNF